MATARATVEGICLKRLKEWDASGINAKYYEDLFKGMSDSDFDNFMQKMITGDNPLSGIIPNFSSVKVGVSHNVAMAASMGYQCYQRIWVTDPVTGTRYLTTNSHLVYETNVCRQIQLHDKKISVPDNNTEIDARTGQPANASRAARCSGPELMMIKARGLNNTIIEMMKFRGGDLVSMRYLDDQIIKTGHGSMAGTPGQSERMPKSVQTMSAILNAMMFTNNFAG
jgi:hypothetical protein